MTGELLLFHHYSQFHIRTQEIGAHVLLDEPIHEIGKWSCWSCHSTFHKNFWRWLESGFS
jgi:hypothetical protein